MDNEPRVDREQWLAEIRRRKVERFDTVHAPGYDERWGEIPDEHAAYVRHVAESVEPGGRVLDAACGTGRFFPTILDAGREVVGVDASAGMLAVAGAKHPDVPTVCMRLEAMVLDEPCDGAICVDALENVPPEDWPTVCARLRGAVRDGGLVYLTVELPDGARYDEVHGQAVAAGLPVVAGEIADVDGGYHYYPDHDQVLSWLAAAGLDVVEHTEVGDCWHLLCRAVVIPASPATAAGRRAAARHRSPARHRSAAARPTTTQLLVGIAAAAALGFLALLIAGGLGGTGLVLVALIEAAVIYALYRWSPAP